MKRIFLVLIATVAFCSISEATTRTVTELDSLGNKKQVIELRDTIINGKKMTDTLSVMAYDSPTSSNNESTGMKENSRSNFLGIDLADGTSSETIIAIVAIVFAFGFPLLVIFTVFFFNYKSRKAKYRLAEQALNSGQQLPPDFFKKVEKTEDIRSKGIKNIFLGIGLFIFLMAMTNFSIGCIGLLIMFTGFGQVIIYYTQESRGHKPYPSGEAGKHKDTENKETLTDDIDIKMIENTDSENNTER